MSDWSQGSCWEANLAGQRRPRCDGAAPKLWSEAGAEQYLVSHALNVLYILFANSLPVSDRGESPVCWTFCNRSQPRLMTSAVFADDSSFVCQHIPQIMNSHQLLLLSGLGVDREKRDSCFSFLTALHLRDRLGRPQQD